MLLSHGALLSIFIDNGWYPNKELSQLAGPMITYLIPLLIAFSGGRLIHDLRGGSRQRTMGLLHYQIHQCYFGAMIMGPLVGWLTNFTT